MTVTVRELIELLSKAPQDYEVFVEAPQDLLDEEYFVDTIRKDDLKEKVFIMTSF